MAATGDDAMLTVGSIALTRAEGAALLGAAVALSGMGLPWLTAPVGPATGFTYGPISPVLGGAALVAAAAAVPDWRPTARYSVVALGGITVAAWGAILVLGIPAAMTGVGVYVTTLGGGVVTSAGYVGLSRQTSPLAATAVICAGALVVNLAILVVVL